MTIYLDVVMLLNFLVDFLLIVGTDRLTGYSPRWGRALFAAGVGGVYGGACLLPGFHFLGNLLWRLVSLGVMAWIAFGFSKNALRKTAVFILLSMALGGIAVGFGRGGAWSLVASAVGVCLLCTAGFRRRVGSVSYIPVELSYAGKRMQITALQDTGNMLRDPVTGKPVLVVDCQIAQRLTGLTQQQLRFPAQSFANAQLPGLRLIPYHAVGQPAGLMLAVRMNDVKIGSWKGSSLVAFAPDGLSGEGTYQALIGGAA